MNEDLEDMVKERTKDLLLSREYFKYLANNIPVLIWTADMNGKLDYINRQWYEYTGFDLEDSKTKQTELVHPDDLETSSVAWRQALKINRNMNRSFGLKETRTEHTGGITHKPYLLKMNKAILLHGLEHVLISMTRRSNWKEKMNLLEWPVMN